jgi:hypothetical protein
MIAPHKVDMPERIEKLLGVKFSAYPHDILAETRKRLEEQASVLGLKFDHQLVDSLRIRNPVVAAKNMEATAKEIYKDGIAKFHRLTGLSTEASFSFKLVSSNAGWSAYSSGELDHFIIRLNRKALPNECQEYVTGLLRHELLGHAIYHTTNLHLIRAGELLPSVGIILLPAYDMIADEGCAEIAKSLYSNDAYGPLAQSISDYGSLCFAQALYMQWKDSTDKAVEQYMDMVPFSRDKDLRKSLTGVADDLFWRYYRWSYSAGRVFFRDALGSFDKETFGSFLKHCYTKPHDVPDLALLGYQHGMSVEGF